MSRIINTAKLIRRNWKKSTFFFGVLTYGVSYFKDKFQTQQMMRAYCEEAKKYGEKPLVQMQKPKHVTVILNPEANYKKSNVQYEKFAAPLLHLAGFKVSVFQTENEKQATDLMKVMSNTDAVIVAGGDGTLQEAVTGLMLRPKNEEGTIPLGVVPLGKTNTIAECLFGEKASSRAQLMAEAVMAVIRETTVKLDVLKIQYLDEDQPVFAMCNFEQGIFADVDLLVQKYWYLGGLKERFTYFINAFKEWHPIENHRLEYVAPCAGCSKCYVANSQKEKEDIAKRWWHVFIPRTSTNVTASLDASAKDMSARMNENCGKRLELPPEYSTISVATTSADTKRREKTGSFAIKIFPKEISMKQFITSGLSHRRSKQADPTCLAQVVEARELVIQVEAPVAPEIPDATPLFEQTANSDVPEFSNPASIESSNSELVNVTGVQLAGIPNVESSNSELVNVTGVQLAGIPNVELSNSELVNVTGVQLAGVPNVEASSLDNKDINIENVDTTADGNTDFNIKTPANNAVSSDSLDSNGVESSVLQSTTESSVLQSTTLPKEDIVLVEDSLKESDSQREKELRENNLDSQTSAEAVKSAVTVSVSSTETEGEKNKEEMKKFSYIDQEKYKRASCRISILPKQVTIYG